MELYDWDELQRQYVSGKYMLCELSKMYGIPYSTLKCHSYRNKWRYKKNKYRTKDLAAKAEEYDLSKELEIADSLSDIIIKAIKDEYQFHRHIVKNRNNTDELILNKIDMHAVSDAVKALKTIEGVKRSINGILTANEKKKYELYERKLGLNEETEEQQEGGIIEISEILEEGTEIRDE